MNDSAVATLPSANGKRSLVTKFAERYSVDPEKMLATLKSTAFKQRDGTAPSNEQMMALLVVADQYELNPFTREIYAFPDKQNGIVPVVGVDGWSRIINSHPDFDGMEYRYSETMVRPEGADSECHEWCEVVIYRKDRSRPIVVREYLDEVYRAPFKPGMKGPWQTHPKRFLRHKTTIQGARLAFGFVGIFDQDEADRIVTRDVTPELQRGRAAAPAEFPAEKFEQSFPAWRDLIQAGNKTAEQVIAMAESIGPLTPEQRRRIHEAATIDADPVEDDPVSAEQD